jgi:hypothetical protein
MLIVYAIITTIAYLAIPTDYEYYPNITQTLFLMTPVFATGAFVVLFLLMGPSSQEGRVWLILALGMAVWTIGEFLWIYITLVYQTEPFPSIADVFYFAGYFFMIVALLYKAVHTKVSLNLVKVGLIAVIVLGITIPTVMFVAMPIINDQGVRTTDGARLSDDDLPYYYFSVAQDNTSAQYFIVNGTDMTEVAPNATIYLEFPSDIDQASVENYFYITDADGNYVDGSYVWNGSVATFVPSENLTAGTDYEAWGYLEYDTLSKVLSLAYPLADMVLLTLSLYILMSFVWGSMVPNGWIIIAGGMVLMTFADILFAVFDWQGISFALSDTLYVWSYLAFAIGAIFQIKFIREMMG